MCGKRLRTFLLLLELCSLLCLSPCFADVNLTDKEAQEILTEIEESKKDLQNVKDKLKTSKEEANELKKESQEQKTQLTELQNISNEQRESYEKQLKEAKKQNAIAWTLTGVSGTGCTVLAILLLIALL